MDYQKYLIKAMAVEKRFWPRIDKKYDDIGNFRVEQQQKTLNIINELPAEALLRAIKLLVINENGKDGRDFIADLFGKIFKKEIDFLIKNKENLNFEEYISKFGTLNIGKTDITRLASVYIHVRRCMGLPDDPSKLLQDIIKTESSLDNNFIPSAESEKMATAWLVAHKNIKTLNQLTYDADLFTAEFLPLELVTKAENIPLRAFEDYKFTKKDIADMIDIANSFNRPYNLNKYLTTAFILKSLARYAESCKNAYLKLALSEDASPGKALHAKNTKLTAEITALHTLLTNKQDALNKLQLDHDRLQKSAAAQAAELDKLQDYTEQLELQLLAPEEDDVGSENIPLNFDGKKIVVIGGHEKWQQKLYERFNDWTFIATDQLNFDPAITAGADLIIFNFKYSSHGLFYRLRNNSDKNKVVFTAATNIDALLRQLARL